MGITLHEMVLDLPKLHQWQSGPSTGGISGDVLVALSEFLLEAEPDRRKFIETGAGNSTIAALLARASTVLSIAPDDKLRDRIESFCDGHQIERSRLDFIVATSELAFSTLVTKIKSEFFVALIDGGHGMPTVFLDFYYMNYSLAKGGYLLIDDTQLHSVAELARLLYCSTEYELVKDMKKTVVFQKMTDQTAFSDFGGQPYVLKMTSEAAGRSWREMLPQ